MENTVFIIHQLYVVGFVGFVLFCFFSPLLSSFCRDGSALPALGRAPAPLGGVGSTSLRGPAPGGQRAAGAAGGGPGPPGSAALLLLLLLLAESPFCVNLRGEASVIPPRKFAFK